MAGVTPIVSNSEANAVGGAAELASDLRARLQRDFDRISSLSSMHPAARRVAKARAYSEARRQMEALELADREARVARAAVADNSVWKPGFGEDVAAARDARDRAGKYLSGEHQQADLDMRQADAVGDAPLAAAIARSAMERASQARAGDRSPWFGVGAAYLGSRTSDGNRPADYIHESQGQNDVSALDAIEHRSISARSAIERAATFRVPRDPELPRDDFAVDALAAADPEEYARSADADARKRQAWNALAR